MKTKYTYALLVKNTLSMHLDQLSTIIPSQHKKRDYALIIRVCEQAKPEKDAIILYSNDYEALKIVMKEHVSWYDYIAGNKKDIQGNVSKLA